MHLLFSFTIESNRAGKLTYWHQGDKLTPEQKKEFERVKKKVELICCGVQQLQIQS